MYQNAINNIYDFNEENIEKIKLLISSNKINNLNSLDKIINPNSINTNINGVMINELSINTDEFKQIKKKSIHKKYKLLNLILPSECILNDSVNNEDIDKIIPLINSKIETIIEML